MQHQTLPTLPTLPPQPSKHLQKAPRIHQLGTTIYDLLPAHSARLSGSATGTSPNTTRDPRPSSTGPPRPLLQIAILVHTPTPDGENNRITEPLPPLSETRFNSPRGPLARARARSVPARSRHRAAGIRAAGVEVQEAFGLLQGGRARVLRVHEALGDLGEGQVFVGGEEVFHAADEVFEVGAQTRALEAVRQARGDAAEAAEEVGGL